MRGLKLSEKALTGLQRQSHLLQMRGLKPICTNLELFATLSHLLQMRGLKQNAVVEMVDQLDVASFTDAWIETCQFGTKKTASRRIFYRCVD